MAEGTAIRRLSPADLRAYKALRDGMLAAYPEAFTSDAPTERQRRADDYLPRLGLDRHPAGSLLLGAWSDSELLGSIGLERDPRVKVRHIGHVIGMMVRSDAQRRGVGGALLDALIAEARGPVGLEMLTLTVTEADTSALRLYERTGFARFGTLKRAIKVGDKYHDKVHMALVL